MMREKTKKETGTWKYECWQDTFIVKEFWRSQLYTAEIVKFDAKSFEVMINGGGLCNFETLEESKACVIWIVKWIEHGKSLAKAEIQKLYENILDFLECIDLDGDRGTEDLEYIKNKLREFLQNNQ